MQTSPNGRKLIEEFEGCILQAYDDYNDIPVRPGSPIHGTLTIGYGHTSSAGPPSVWAGQFITKDEADRILSVDLTAVEKLVNNTVKVPLNQNQFDALVSFQYNTGALGRSSVLHYLSQNNYEMAANALTLYNKANGRVLQGLVRRREAEKELFLCTKPSPLSVPTLPSASVPTSSVPMVSQVLNLILQFFKQLFKTS